MWGTRNPATISGWQGIFSLLFLLRDIKYVGILIAIFLWISIHFKPALHQLWLKLPEAGQFCAIWKINKLLFKNYTFKNYNKLANIRSQKWTDSKRVIPLWCLVLTLEQRWLRLEYPMHSDVLRFWSTHCVWLLLTHSINGHQLVLISKVLPLFSF